MFSADRIYSADIETDNSNGHGLNPQFGRITEVALSTANDDIVFDDDDEKDLLENLSAHLLRMPPGLITTWNGAFFDVPFLWERARVNNVLPFLGLTPDPGLVPKYEPLPGHDGGYQAVFHSPDMMVPHQHLDVSGMYRKFADEAGVSWSLKPVCAAKGIAMVELDRERLHDYSREERLAYVCSDTRGTRALALEALGLS